MKKTISIATAIFLLFAILAMPVLAHKNNASYGDVPKSADAITIDGDKDAVYEKGLYFRMAERQERFGDPPTATTGDAWVLWQDGFIFIFAEVKDAYLMAQDAYANQSGEPWMTDSIECFLDWNNNSEGNESDQFRIDATGWRSFEFRATTGESSYGEEENIADGKFEGKSKTVSGGYNVEFKIPIQEGKSAGADIGFLLQINDMQDDDATRCMVFSASSTDEALSWVPAEYDYMVLSANEVTAVEAPPPAEEEPIIDENAVGGGEENVHVETPAPAPAPVAPPTGDSGILFALLVLAVSASVLVLKSKKNRV